MKNLRCIHNCIKRINKDNILYLLKALKKKDMPCPYCGAYTAIVFGKRYIFFDICKCQDCSLFFMNPVYLSDKDIESFYNERYFTDITIIPDEKELELITKMNFQGTTKYYNDALIVIKKLVDGNRLLEFGSSWGYFLFQAQSHGFYPTGIEISPKRAAFCRDHLSINVFSNIDLIEEKFNVICTFHTLEHLINLRDIFDKFYEKLLPRGSLIIEVPNFDLETKGKSVYQAIGKVHPCGFTRQFFETNLPRHGFQEINIAGNYADLLKRPEERSFLKDVIILRAKRGM